MNRKKKLRLRKQVIMCIPVILMVITLFVSFIINKKEVYSSEINTNKTIASNNEIKNEKKLSDNEYLQAFNKMIELRQKDNTIIYYAQTFKLDVDKTLELAHKFTNNYENKEYKKNFIIAPKSLKKTIKDFSNFEAGVVYFVRDLYRYPERYGTSIEQMRLDETPTTKNTAKDGNIYMDNGMTFEQYLGKTCDLFGVDKSIALAIVYQESGIKKSNLFKYSNNIGGHRGYDGWMKYTTLEAGIIAHVISVKTLIEKYNIDLSNETGISELSGIYVNGNISKPQSSWVEKVTIFKNKINEKDLFLKE